MKFALMITGYKGAQFLKRISKNPEFVVSYDNKEGNNDCFHQIKQLCKDRNIRFIEQKSSIGLENLIATVDKLFLVGWQYLIRKNFEKLVVFHDSYLPERRGFSPTIDALYSRSKYLGASAFCPYKNSTEPDYGEVFYRMKKNISYPISLQESFKMVVEMYVEIFKKIVNEGLQPRKIDYSSSTFSIWKDEEDMRINWKDTSDNILNKIFILGYPYDGAHSTYESEKVRIIEAETLPDLNITNRSTSVGKILRIEQGKPVIICGAGLLRLNKVIKENGNVIQFGNLRRRFI